MTNIRTYSFLISHPSDVENSIIESIKTSVKEWNSCNSEHYRICFEAYDWENDIPTCTLPQSGQDVINNYIDRRCDAVLACFNRKLGSPVDGAASGTVSEIENAIVAGKPVGMLVVHQNDIEHETTLVEYIQKYRGLYKEFDSEESLKHQLILWLNARASYAYCQPDPDTEKYREVVRRDKDIEILPKTIIKNYFPNPFFRRTNPSFLYSPESSMTTVNDGLTSSADCIFLFKEYTCQSTWYCLRTLGLRNGIVILRDVRGKEYGILYPEFPHIDVYIPNGIRLEVVFHPQHNNIMACHYFGLTNAHIFAFDAHTAPFPR